jgi:hypothetical protein
MPAGGRGNAMRAPRVSELQRELLISLLFGWRRGGDDRSVRGLRIRGLVVMRWHVIIDDVFGDRPIQLPHLTPAGDRLAKQLWLAAPVDEKTVVYAEIEELRQMGLLAAADARRRGLA